MIKNIKILEKFEMELMKRERFSYKEALEIYEALWCEAKALKIFPLKDPMDGIDIKIKIAGILNSCLKTF
jgi:hypothetical protein